MVMYDDTNFMMLRTILCKITIKKFTESLKISIIQFNFILLILLIGITESGRVSRELFFSL